MAITKCKECGAELSSKAATCPKCGSPQPNASHLSGKTVFWTLVMAGLLFWWMGGGGLEHHVDREIKKAEDRVANDFVSQYQIAKREGNKMQVCVQAGLAAAAFLQAKDEANYRRWKDTEAGDCRRAGVPQ